MKNINNNSKERKKKLYGKYHKNVIYEARNIFVSFVSF